MEVKYPSDCWHKFLGELERVALQLGPRRAWDPMRFSLAASVATTRTSRVRLCKAPENIRQFLCDYLTAIICLHNCSAASSGIFAQRRVHV